MYAPGESARNQKKASPKAYIRHINKHISFDTRIIEHENTLTSTLTVKRAAQNTVNLATGYKLKTENREMNHWLQAWVYRNQSFGALGYISTQRSLNSVYRNKMEIFLFGTGDYITNTKSTWSYFMSPKTSRRSLYRSVWGHVAAVYTLTECHARKIYADSSRTPLQEHPTY